MPITGHEQIAVVGGGPAGLMATDILAQAGWQVHLFDAMPSVGRKFLRAGKGGLNLSHSAPMEEFILHYGARQKNFLPLLDVFGPKELRLWCQELGIQTFIGSSGRIFPQDMLAAPLLRRWLHHLHKQNVQMHMRHRFMGFDEGNRLLFTSPTEEIRMEARATILALGGGSWPQLGSDGKWTSFLESHIKIAPLQPANCGFNCPWSTHLVTNFAGQPLKGITISFTDYRGIQQRKTGECLLSAYGLEGSLIYTLSASLRDTLIASGPITITLDLLPDRSEQNIAEKLTAPRGSRSLASHLHRCLGLKGVKVALLHEYFSKEVFADPQHLAAAIKAVPIPILTSRPLQEAISSAGGVLFEELDDNLMIKAMPGVFCAGEMLDWEAPTGGYLLTGCLSTGFRAGRGAVSWLSEQQEKSI